MAIELPDEEVAKDPFNMRVTMLVVAITFLGSIVAYLQTRSGNREEVAARNAQINATRGIGAQLEVAAETTSAYQIFVQGSSYDRRATIARARARIAGTGTPEGKALTAEAQRWEQVKQAVSPLSPMLSEQKYLEKEPYVNPYFDDRYVGPNLVAIRQAAQSEEIGAWGSKSNSYVAVITILAVALFLLGLSLTIGGQVRTVLAIPAVAIFATSIVWTGIIAAGRVPRTPEKAMKHVAEGDRLSSVGYLDFKGAIAEYTKAIEIRPDYAYAYARRGNAHFLKGSPEVAQGATGFVSITDPASLKASIADGQKAIDLGFKDTVIYSTQGFQNFLVGDYEKALELTSEALKLNPRLAPVWANLGLIHAARGSQEEADKGFTRALTLIRKRPDLEQTAFVNAARTDLEILQKNEPSRKDLVRRYKEQVTAFESELQLKKKIKRGSKGSAKITEWEVDGAEITANFDYKNLAKGAATAFIWYYRADSKAIWAHDPRLFSYVYESELDGDGSSVAINNSHQCPTPGQYRLDVYEDGTLIGSASHTIKPGVLGEPTLYESPILNFTLCHPQDWKIEESEDFIDFNSPDGLLLFEVGVLPVGGVSGTAEELEVTTIGLLALGSPPRGGQEEFTVFDFGGVRGHIAYYTVDLGGQPATKAVAASLDVANGTLRTMVATARDEEIETLNELLDTLRFTDAPEQEED